jgi:hypothetical protein
MATIAVPPISSVGNVVTQQRGSVRMNWSQTTLMSSLARGAFILALDRGMAAHTQGFAGRVQAYARENAPWTDRTGAARAGLTAQGQQRLFQYRIFLYHTVDYGIWLEVARNGKYAIIVPTIIVMGQQLMHELSITMTGMGAPTVYSRSGSLPGGVE